MNNSNILKLSLLSSLLAATATSNARWYSYDLFAELSQEMERMHEHMEKMRELHESLFQDAQTTAPKATISRPQLPEIKTEVSQDDTNVMVKISVDAQKDAQMLDKKDIDITIDDTGLSAILTLKNGKVELYIDRSTMQVIKKAEIKKEKKDDKDQIKSKVIGYSSSSYIERLPHVVDLRDTKAQVKDNVLTLTLPKKKHTKVTVVAS